MGGGYASGKESETATRLREVWTKVRTGKGVHLKGGRKPPFFEVYMADGVGFEPTVRFHARWFSRPVP